jgi:hypothetical protein
VKIFDVLHRRHGDLAALPSFRKVRSNNYSYTSRALELRPTCRVTHRFIGAVSRREAGGVTEVRRRGSCRREIATGGRAREETASDRKAQLAPSI